ncbi:toll/interleukin-1 receptor domain-containing protein [uncultured Desulfobacter sp.]|uniref:toll/interleukin-1 receptor domain-containing protein n=1 Tax=uncultured Desulfobacter sp. TaxID=240139 RepID=UPI0037496047
MSHSSKDNLVAETIVERLQQQGYRSVFLDFDPESGIPAGRSWEHELYRQLRACQSVIYLYFFR